MNTLYKKDSKGKIRIWRMEIDGAKFRTIAGLAVGKQVTSEWTVTEGKNIGRANETTPEQQADFEVKALYTKKLEKDYHLDLANVEKARYFAPMLAHKFKSFPKNEQVYAQPKLDGIRCIVTKDGMFARSGKPIITSSHIREALQPVFDNEPGAILDGELYNHAFKDDFNSLVSAIKRTKPTERDYEIAKEIVQYHVYDVGHLNGAVFAARNTWIQLFLNNIDHVEIVETQVILNSGNLDHHYEQWRNQGYEGQMVRLNQPYEQKRSKTLLKRKEFVDEEFEIVEICEGKGNWSGYAKRIVCRLEDGRTFGSGVAGNREFTKQLLDDAADYIGKQVTVQYFSRTPAGIPRFGVAKVFHKTERL